MKRTILVEILGGLLAGAVTGLAILLGAPPVVAAILCALSPVMGYYIGHCAAKRSWSTISVGESMSPNTGGERGKYAERYALYQELQRHMNDYQTSPWHITVIHKKKDNN